MNPLIKSISPLIMLWSTPCASSDFRRASHEGSTPVEVNPFSASYPMCATCMKEPWVGPEIMDLSIFPPLEARFLDEDDLAFAVCREMSM